MVVDAFVWYWTNTGMSRTQRLTHSVGYILVSEVERLLEEAHERGRQQGLAQAVQVVTNTK